MHAWPSSLMSTVFIQFEWPGRVYQDRWCWSSWGCSRRWLSWFGSGHGSFNGSERSSSYHRWDVWTVETDNWIIEDIWSGVTRGSAYTITGKCGFALRVVWYMMVWCGVVCGWGMVLNGWVWYCLVWGEVEGGGMVWYGMVWYGMVWYGMVWYGMVWYGIV